MQCSTMDTPMGKLTLVTTGKGLSAVSFGARIPPNGILDEQANRVYIDQLSEYFAGKRKDFDLPLDLNGTPFQLSVWRALLNIPYGETRTYGEIARSLGKPQAARAVGMANHDNPVAVVVPCHRVVGHDGSLTGYAGGLHLKRALLALERQGRTLFT
jgi:methylated-DNA-[protein]-cysteine S-methyltransferase